MNSQNSSKIGMYTVVQYNILIVLVNRKLIVDEVTLYMCVIVLLSNPRHPLNYNFCCRFIKELLYLSFAYQQLYTLLIFFL